MYKTLHGLILREARYKESSKILTILTEEEGKITAQAKGALRKTSKCAAASQLLTWGELTFFENKGRYTLTEGAVLEDFAALRDDLERYALGCYFAELLESVSDADYPNSEMLHFGLNALFALSRELYPAAHIKAVFELRLMCMSGFAPELTACPICGNTQPERPRLSLTGGRLLCASCVPNGEGKTLPLCSASLAAMRHASHADPKKAWSFTLDKESSGRFEQACEEYTLSHLDRGFGTLDYWKSIRI